MDSDCRPHAPTELIQRHIRSITKEGDKMKLDLLVGAVVVAIALLSYYFAVRIVYFRKDRSKKR